MKLQHVILSFFYLLLLAGCTDGEKSIESKPEQVFASEEEKLLNEVFLSVIGTDLYYKKISEEEMDMVNEIVSKEGYDEAIAYYEKHRKEDPTKLVVFTRDKFWEMHYPLNSKNILPDRLRLIKHILTENNLDSTTQILETLSQPLELSSVNLTRTGRYQVFREQDRDRVKGEYRMYGSFNTSKIYIDNAKERAVFIYERNCMEGFKCAEGNLVILEKSKEGWQVSKKYNLYVS